MQTVLPAWPQAGTGPRRAGWQRKGSTGGLEKEGAQRALQGQLTNPHPKAGPSAFYLLGLPCAAARASSAPVPTCMEGAFHNSSKHHPGLSSDLAHITVPRCPTHSNDLGKHTDGGVRGLQGRRRGGAKDHLLGRGRVILMDKDTSEGREAAPSREQQSAKEDEDRAGNKSLQAIGGVSKVIYYYYFFFFTTPCGPLPGWMEMRSFSQT